VTVVTNKEGDSMPGRVRQHNGKTYTVSAAHTLADLFPWLPDDELQGLADDIKANGQKHPIVRHKGIVVDGRHRELACLVAGVKPVYADLPATRTEAEIRAGVISANVKRRHLTASQRAMIAAELETVGHGGDRKGQDALVHLGPTRAELAADLNVSPRTVASAAKVKNDAPELVEPVKAGKLDVKTAARVADQPEDVREQIAAAPDPKAAAEELLPPPELKPLNGTLPKPSIDAGAKEPHPLYGKGKGRARRKLSEHRYGDILEAMRDLSRMITVAMNAPDGGRLKDYLRFLGLVQDRGFILNGKKYNARFRGFQFRHAVKIATGRGRVLTKAELMKACLADWENSDDLEQLGEAVPE
jgi:ParB-like chromosome segregation protein Spo0J